jgi:hypothetical protein
MVAGVLVAIPSGAGVALSVLGGNAGSLVGTSLFSFFYHFYFLPLEILVFLRRRYFCIAAATCSQRGLFLGSVHCSGYRYNFFNFYFIFVFIILLQVEISSEVV